MLEKLKLIARTKNYFTYLLPVFFVLHGFTYNYNLVKVGIAVWVTFIFIIAAIALYAINKLIFSDKYKAHLFTFSLLFVNFFFGYIYEALNNISKKLFFGKYWFLLLSFATLLTVIFVLLKRKRTITRKIGSVLNIFLLCLLIVEAVTLISKLISPNRFSLQLNTSELTVCKDCNKPDVYLILTDGYAGPMESSEMLHFDNSRFYQAVADRKFHIIDQSRSNYNYTSLSMASILNMSYLNLNQQSENKNVAGALKAIRRNQMANFMKMNGYKVVNNSVFQMDESEREATILFPGSTALLMGSTLTYHVFRIIQYRLYGNNNLQIIRDGQLSTIRKSNNLLYDKTVELAKTPSKDPRFIYCHLLMPHFPYFYNKDGIENPAEKVMIDNRFNQGDYIQYLEYTSKKVLALIDTIQLRSAKPPIIFLLSDHGFREFRDTVEHKYYFSNISAVYMPDSNYNKFYNGMSNVNLFRTLLNVQFNQKMDILKDSSVYYEER